MRVCANAVEAVFSSRIDAKKPCNGVKASFCQSYPLWLQIYVSIVNRYIEDYYDYVHYVHIRDFITFDVLLIFQQLFDKFRDQILYKLCDVGALHDLIKIHACLALLNGLRKMFDVVTTLHLKLHVNVVSWIWLNGCTQLFT